MHDVGIDTQTRTAARLPEVADPDRLEDCRRMLLASVGLPRSYFRGRSVVQIGGSAEAALQYAVWGAKVTLVATDDRLSEYTERLFLRHRQPLRIESARTLVGDPVGMSHFEFVANETPLLHSDDPLRDLDVLLKSLARDAVLLVALPELHGWRRRTAMRRIVASISASNDERARNARAWFSEHVAITARSRGGDPEQLLHDLFVAQTGRPVEWAEICGQFREHGMAYLGSDPLVRSPYGSNVGDVFDHAANRNGYRFLERMWAATWDESRQSARDVDPSRLEREVDAEIAALEAIEERVRRRDIDDETIARLRRGGTGVDRITIVVAKQ